MHTKEIKCRIAMAKTALFMKKNYRKNSRLNGLLRKRLLKNCVWRVAVHGAQTWIIQYREGDCRNI